MRCLVTFLITAVLNLCAVSYDRLTAIVLPRESRITIRGAKIVMTLTWLAGLALAFPLPIYRNYKVIRRFRSAFLLLARIRSLSFSLLALSGGRAGSGTGAQERQWRNFLETFCAENTTILRIYWHAVLIALVVVPMTVMITCYSAIFWKVKHKLIALPAIAVGLSALSGAMRRPSTAWRLSALTIVPFAARSIRG